MVREMEIMRWMRSIDMASSLFLWKQGNDPFLRNHNVLWG